MSIRKLRTKAEAALGTAFDQRPFHDAYLALGAVPLPVMESQMEQFIATEKSKLAKNQTEAR